MQITTFFEKQGKLFWAGAGIVLVAFLGMIDYFTGYEFNFSAFYLIPIAFVTWYAGREWGLVISGVSAITWFLADIFSGNAYSSDWLYLWNTMIRLIVFIFTTYLLVALRKEFNLNQGLARIDYVTGAITNRYFYHLAEIEIGRSDRYSHPFTFAYIDLDNFKEVNDRFGHSTGDKVLKAVADIVQHQIRKLDTFARLGGDEFALLMPETGEIEAQSVVSRLRRDLLDEMQRNDWPVTFSIGVVTFIKIPKTVDDMVKMADDVMYPIKENGKNGVSYTIYEG